MYKWQDDGRLTAAGRVRTGRPARPCYNEAVQTAIDPPKNRDAIRKPEFKPTVQWSCADRNVAIAMRDLAGPAALCGSHRLYGQRRVSAGALYLLAGRRQSSFHSAARGREPECHGRWASRSPARTIRPRLRPMVQAPQLPTSFQMCRFRAARCALPTSRNAAELSISRWMKASGCAALQHLSGQRAFQRIDHINCSAGRAGVLRLLYRAGSGSDEYTETDDSRDPCFRGGVERTARQRQHDLRFHTRPGKAAYIGR